MIYINGSLQDERSFQKEGKSSDACFDVRISLLVYSSFWFMLADIAL